MRSRGVFGVKGVARRVWSLRKMARELSGQPAMPEYIDFQNPSPPYSFSLSLHDPLPLLPLKLRGALIELPRGFSHSRVIK